MRERERQGREGELLLFRERAPKRRADNLLNVRERREAALRARFSENEDLTFLFWFSSPSPADDAYLGGGNGPSGYIADVLGGRNAIQTEADWPAVGWGVSVWQLDVYAEDRRRVANVDRAPC